MTTAYPPIYIYKRIVQAKLFIDAHFYNSIDLDDIADEAWFSKFHFIRLFKKIYGKTPHQYLTKVRIDNARLFLQKGLTVRETCFAVGFESVNSFAGLFKQHSSVSPALYQRQYTERQQLIKRNPLQFIPPCFAEQNGWSKKSNFGVNC